MMVSKLRKFYFFRWCLSGAVATALTFIYLFRHVNLFAQYRHKIDKTKSEDCPCAIANKDPQTLRHRFECPGTSVKRQEIFGTTSVEPAAHGEHLLELQKLQHCLTTTGLTERSPG